MKNILLFPFPTPLLELLMHTLKNTNFMHFYYLLKYISNVCVLQNLHPKNKIVSHDAQNILADSSKLLESNSAVLIIIATRFPITKASKSKFP